MSEEISQATGAEQVAEEVITPVEEVVIPTKEEDKDLPLTSQQLREMGVPIDDLEEEEKKTVIPETKEETLAPQDTVVTAPAETIEPRSVSSIDKRIAKLYQETQILQGSEAPEMTDILAAIEGYSFQDKEQALHRLLTERRTLRGDTGVAEMDVEDQEALIEAQVEERLQSMQAEIHEKERLDDLISMLEQHPELDERKPEYDKQLEQAVNTLYERGMKVSEAYALVMKSIETAKEKQIQKEKNQAEISKQKALSGVVSATNNAPKNDKGMTWEQFDELRTTDPDRYTKLLKEGFRPEDE
jgi:hypothetical protein